MMRKRCAAVAPSASAASRISVGSDFRPILLQFALRYISEFVQGLNGDDASVRD